MEKTTAEQENKEIRAVAVAAKSPFSFNPQNMTEAMSFAKMLAKSNFVPKQYKDQEGDILVAMHYAAVLGLDVLQALPDIAVINGRPGIFGSLGKALLRRHGFRIEEWDIERAQKEKRARCKITRPDTGEVIERTFSQEDAITAKLWGKQGPWTEYPWRQMAWRAFWFAARDGAADILRGMWGVEELRDFGDSVETTAIETPAAPVEIQPQASAPSAVKTTSADAVLVINREERANIFNLCNKFKTGNDTLRDHLKKAYGIDGTEKLPRADYPALCAWIENPQSELIRE